MVGFGSLISALLSALVFQAASGTPVPGGSPKNTTTPKSILGTHFKKVLDSEPIGRFDPRDREPKEKRWKDGDADSRHVDPSETAVHAAIYAQKENNGGEPVFLQHGAEDGESENIYLKYNESKDQQLHWDTFMPVLLLVGIILILFMVGYFIYLRWDDATEIDNQKFEKEKFEKARKRALVRSSAASTEAEEAESAYLRGSNFDEATKLSIQGYTVNACRLTLEQARAAGIDVGNLHYNPKHANRNPNHRQMIINSASAPKHGKHANQSLHNAIIVNRAGQPLSPASAKKAYRAVNSGVVCNLDGAVQGRLAKKYRCGEKEGSLASGRLLPGGSQR